MASLAPYTGNWTRREAAHLLRRASFGASKAQLDAAVGAGLQTTLTSLFTPTAAPAVPVHPVDGSQWVPEEGKIWTSRVIIGDQANAQTSTAYDISRGAQYYNVVTKAWWTRNMIHAPVSIHEKLTLFWSNHFATEMTTVLNGIFSFNLLAYLRANAFGSVKDMARRVTLDPAMLVYLNGNVNTKGSANENYGRELQELLTIGKGAEAGPGDYTTYTEDDVRAAARVLTGWRELGARDIVFTQGDRDLRDNPPKAQPQFPDNPNLIFIASQHDTADKQFSPRYNNRVIKGRSGPNAGLDELNDMLDMIFEQEATALHIVTKLYRWFVCSATPHDVVRDILQPLANELYSNGYVVAPVLRKLLSSEHFFDQELRGSQLRSPADLVIGAMRTIPTWTPPTDPAQRDRFYMGYAATLASLQMDLNDPSSVAGWEAYYQAPDYDKHWLSTATLPLRNAFTDALLFSNMSTGRRKVLESLEFAQTLSDPSDSLKLIDEVNEIFFALPFSENVRMQLAEEVLMRGGRYYEWTEIWMAFQNNPTNGANRDTVRVYLDRLFTYMFRMAEFQLG